MPVKHDLYNQRFYKSAPHPSNYPVISNVAISNLGLVTWTTDVTSTSQVLYGLTSQLGLLTTYDATYVTSHSVQLSNLTNGLTYYVKVQSFNTDALSISDLYVFTFGGATGDDFIGLEDGSGRILAEDGTYIKTES